MSDPSPPTKRFETNHSSARSGTGCTTSSTYTTEHGGPALETEFSSPPRPAFAAPFGKKKQKKKKKMQKKKLGLKNKKKTQKNKNKKKKKKKKKTKKKLKKKKQKQKKKKKRSIKKKARKKKKKKRLDLSGALLATTGNDKRFRMSPEDAGTHKTQGLRFKSRQGHEGQTRRCWKKNKKARPAPKTRTGARHPGRITVKALERRGLAPRPSGPVPTLAAFGEKNRHPEGNAPLSGGQGIHPLSQVMGETTHRGLFLRRTHGLPSGRKGSR